MSDAPSGIHEGSKFLSSKARPAFWLAVAVPLVVFAVEHTYNTYAGYDTRIDALETRSASIEAKVEALAARGNDDKELASEVRQLREYMIRRWGARF